MNTQVVKTILVVDDTEIMRDLLADVLQNDGYETDKASDGKVATKMVSNKHYDLVITDMHMPRQNGLITARKIREISPTTLVVMTDSYPDRLGELAEKEGVVGLICKPFDLTELRLILTRIEGIAAERAHCSGSREHIS